MTSKRHRYEPDISDIPVLPSHYHPMSGEPVWDADAVRKVMRAMPNPALALLKWIDEKNVEDAEDAIRCWMYGDFAELRRDWSDFSPPPAIFIGADPTYPVPAPKARP